MKDKDGKIKKILDVLKNAEPILRFIEVVFVVFGTIFVSAQANSIAIRSNTIAERQLEISIKENQPNFVIHNNLEDSADGIKNANSVLYVSNTEGKCTNIDVNTACFIVFDFISSSTNEPDYLIYSFPLDGFYSLTVVTGDSEGLICKKFEYNNWDKYHELYVAVLENPAIHGSIGIKQYVRLTYSDFLGEKHTQYFLINSLRQTLISEDYGREVFEEYSNATTRLSVYDLTLEELLNKVPEFATQSEN